MSEGPASAFSRFVYSPSPAQQDVVCQEARDEALAGVAQDGNSIRKFSLSSPSGQAYSAFLFEPATFDGDHPCAVVYCSSELSNQSQLESIRFVQRILPLGISVFVLGLTGAHIALSEPGTVVQAVKVLRDIDDKSYERVALWGRSAGAIAVLRAAVEDPSFVAVVCDSAYSDLIPLLDLPKWVETKLMSSRHERGAANASGSGVSADFGVEEVHAPADLQPILRKRAGNDGAESDESSEEAARREEIERRPLEIEGSVTVISEPFDLTPWISSAGVSSTDFDINAWMSSIVAEEAPVDLVTRCHVPAMFMHGKADDIVPIDHCKALTKAYAGECMAFHIEGLDHDAHRCLPHMASAALFLIGMFGKNENCKSVTTLVHMAALARHANAKPQMPLCALDLEINGQLQLGEPAAYRRGLLLSALAVSPEARAANLQEVTLPSACSSIPRSASDRHHRYLSRLEGKALFPDLADEVTVAWIISDDSCKNSAILRSERQRSPGAVYFLTLSAQLLKLSIVHFEPEDEEPEQENEQPQFTVAGLRVYVQRPAVRALNHFPSQIFFPVQLILCEKSAPAITGGASVAVSVGEKFFKAILPCEECQCSDEESSSSSSSQLHHFGAPIGIGLYSGTVSAGTASRRRLELQVLPLDNERLLPGLHSVIPLSASETGHWPDDLPRSSKPPLATAPSATTPSSRDVQGSATLLTKSSLVTRQDGSLTFSNTSSSKPVTCMSDSFGSSSFILGSHPATATPWEYHTAALTGMQAAEVVDDIPKVGGAALMQFKAMVEARAAANEETISGSIPGLQSIEEPTQPEDIRLEDEVEAKAASDMLSTVPGSSCDEDGISQEFQRLEAGVEAPRELPFEFDMNAYGISNYSWPEEQGRLCHQLERHTWSVPGGLN